MASTNYRPEFTKEHHKIAADWRSRQTEPLKDPVFARVVRSSVADDAFRARLLSHTEDVLEEYGVSLVDGVEIKVLEESPKVRYLVLPAAPAQASVDLKDQDLVSIDRGRLAADFEDSADRGDGNDSGNSGVDFSDKPDTGDANVDWADQ